MSTNSLLFETNIDLYSKRDPEHSYLLRLLYNPSSNKIVKFQEIPEHTTLRLCDRKSSVKTPSVILFHRPLTLKKQLSSVLELY